MKADSVGLEIVVEISKKEAACLKDSTLASVLNFRDDSNHAPRKIPLRLKVGRTNSTGLFVNAVPRNVYFGDCQKCSATICGAAYAYLIRTGYFGQRFFTTGRLEIFIVD